DEYIFAVIDNGIGIEKQHLERIFNIFQRLHSRQEYDGLGMGLSISQRIIQEHKGKIWAISTPGKGSTFYFTIPIKN
ncbi:MAG: ATP-binding protein, partial [Methanobacterium sp.]